MKLLRMLSAVLALLLLAAPASATTITSTGTITGRVESTWIAAGGSAVLGNPIGTETKIVAYSRNTYHQHTEKGFVYWDGSQGGKTWALGEMPSLSGVKAERDAIARYGFAPGVLYRSAKLCDATTNNKRLITALLHNKGRIIDLRGSGTCTEPSFPSVVSKVRISVPSHADYSRYVTGETERIAFGKVLTAMANTEGPVWVHCTEGKDRTGWAAAMVMFALGAQPGVVLQEFLLTDEADEADFFEGLDAIAMKYDPNGTSQTNGRDEYLRTGLKLTPETLEKLRAKFGR